MTYAYLAAFLLVLAAGWLFRRKTVALGRALFGESSRLRYVNRRWVIEGRAGGHTVRYTTGGFGLFPALTYLHVELPLAQTFSFAAGDAATRLPGEAAALVAGLAARDGFKRIDAFDDAVLRMPVLGRVSWLAPAGGIMLRRFTRRGGDAAFVRDDLTDLLTIADALAARRGRPH